MLTFFNYYLSVQCGNGMLMGRIGRGRRFRAGNRWRVRGNCVWRGDGDGDGDGDGKLTRDEFDKQFNITMFTCWQKFVDTIVRELSLLSLFGIRTHIKQLFQNARPPVFQTHHFRTLQCQSRNSSHNSQCQGSCCLPGNAVSMITRPSGGRRIGA